MSRADEPQRVVDVLLAVAREEILKDFRRDSCIASTRVATEVLRHFGVRAYPLAVTAMVFNAPFAARLRIDLFPRDAAETRHWAEEDGTWSVGIGFGRGGPGSWTRHLVAIAERRWLVDLSLDQADRPEHGIALRPLAHPVAEDFLRGLAPLTLEVGSVLVQYDADPRERSFEHARDWRLVRRWGPAVRRSVARMEPALHAGGAR